MSTPFADKKILVGVSGSIAAYKAAVFVRLLMKAGAQVKVCMTKHATDFVSPLTFSTLTGNPVAHELFTDGQWNHHVALGIEHDAYIILPATANVIAKCAHGNCDDMVTAVFLSARCPVWVAPAMDVDMWKHPATQQNIELLSKRGTKIIPPVSGPLASGLEGEGRLPEPEDVVELLKSYFTSNSSKKKVSNKNLINPQDTLPNLKGKSILITAGPTYENIDPVRFIGNYSSGKMGIACAESALAAGAHVELILGPSDTYPISSGIHVTRVVSAIEMMAACKKYWKSTDIGIFTAAVADYRPVKVHSDKIKKKSKPLSIDLIENPDIAATCSMNRRSNQIVIGFGLETTDAEKYGWAKLKKKQFDMLVLNTSSSKNKAFGSDSNQVSFLYPGNKKKNFKLMSKQEIALNIIQEIPTLKNSRI